MDLRCLSLCVLLYCGCLGQTHDENRDCLIETGESLLGVTEHTSNDSPMIRTILSNAGIEKPAPYCSATVKYLFDQCLVMTPITAWSPTAVPYERAVWQAGKTLTRLPLPADVFGIYNPKKGRISHVGIVFAWPEEGDYFLSLEGNVGIGGGVQGITILRRRKSSIHLVCNWIDDETITKKLEEGNKELEPIIEEVKEVPDEKFIVPFWAMCLGVLGTGAAIGFKYA